MNSTITVSPDNLNSVMEFDKLIRINSDGTVTPIDYVSAFECHNGELTTLYSHSDFSLLNGFSGQYGYSGPVFHNSEFIGGGLARHILSTPGEYVALVNYSVCDCNCEDDIDGWVIAFREMPESL